MSGMSSSGNEKKSGVPFMMLDQNSENYKNWKNSGMSALVRDEEGHENRGMFRAELLSKLAGSSKMRAPRADGDFPNDEADFFAEMSPESPRNKHPLEGSRCPKIVSLKPEISLNKMGYAQENTIDWTKVELPMKTDLHQLLHYRITKYLNPDVLVKIGNHEYRCHLLVLQCYSTYFNEKPVSRLEIPENCVTKNAFMHIYDWMLHLGDDSCRLLTRDNILEIFIATQYLGVKELEDQCWAFIDNEDLFSEDNAFMLYLNARKHGNTAIMEIMVPRVQRFFLTLVSSKDFLELVVEEVCVFLKSNYICIHGEIEVFMSAVRWLMYDWDKRSKYLIEVMQCVRFGLIAPWQLVDIRRNPESEEFLLVTKSPEVSQMIEDGLAFAIIKYWHGNETSDYHHWIELLGLTEPLSRNWDSTAKNYLFYRDFLADLDNYRRMQKLEKEQSRGAADEEVLHRNESNDSSPLLPSTPPMMSNNKKNPPLSMMAELMARRDGSHKTGHPGRHSVGLQ